MSAITDIRTGEKAYSENSSPQWVSRRYDSEGKKDSDVENAPQKSESGELVGAASPPDESEGGRYGDGAIDGSPLRHPTN